MAARKNENIEELTDVIRRGARDFTAAAVARLAQSPDAVLSALAATASILERSHTTCASPIRRDSPSTGGTGVQPEVTQLRGKSPVYVEDKQAAYRLNERTVVMETSGDLLSTEEAAELLNLKGRQSVHNRVTKKQLISFEGSTRNVLIPRAQFDSHGRPFPGIAEVRALFPDGYSAWHWLTTPSSALAGETPLNKLEQGKVDEVVTNARGYRQGDFG